MPARANRCWPCAGWVLTSMNALSASIRGCGRTPRRAGSPARRLGGVQRPCRGQSGREPASLPALPQHRPALRWHLGPAAAEIQAATLACSHDPPWTLHTGLGVKTLDGDANPQHCCSRRPSESAGTGRPVSKPTQSCPSRASPDGRALTYGLRIRAFALRASGTFGAWREQCLCGARRTSRCVD